MGICSSKVAEPTSHSKKIDADLKKAVKDDISVIRLLLLGAGESGKSTVFKQVKILHNNGFNDAERKAEIATIHQNVVTGIQILISACDILNLAIPKEFEALSNNLSECERTMQTVSLDVDMANKIELLWRTGPIQEAFRNRSLVHLGDNSQYFFDNLDRITSQNYLPSDEDILRSRVRTTGVARAEFAMEGSKFELIDVGGQRNERRKWIHCFDSVQAVLFVASLNDYDLTLFEDGVTNRMHEALNLFSEICNSRFFAETAMILFLNKRDLFAEKILTKNITSAFPEYEGPQECTSAIGYIQRQFEAVNDAPNKPIYCHITCATDKNQLHQTLLIVNDIMLNNNLKESGFI